MPERTQLAVAQRRPRSKLQGCGRMAQLLPELSLQLLLAL